ncbi:hypothetical protein [Neisseria flavescens]|uniref:hypothetical protein n=1 Tax=Neisseria flavescens TaxID=484 RepID=UPI000317F69B|nr:hypothetical protein [Neisseria flavescens]
MLGRIILHSAISACLRGFPFSLRIFRRYFCFGFSSIPARSSACRISTRGRAYRISGGG